MVGQCKSLQLIESMAYSLFMGRHRLLCSDDSCYQVGELHGELLLEALLAVMPFLILKCVMRCDGWRTF